MQLSSQLFHPNTCLISMGFVPVSTLIKTQLSSIKFDQTYQLEMPTTVTKTTRVEISTLSKNGRFALEHSSQLFHPNTCLNSMGFVAVSTLIKTHFHVFPPTSTWNYTYPLGTFSTPTPIGTPTIHLEHPPQVQTVVVGWIFQLTVLLCEFQFFHPKTPFCRS